MSFEDMIDWYYSLKCKKCGDKTPEEQLDENGLCPPCGAQEVIDE